ncbi:glycosyltransferase family 4 protein [Erythrobacter sp. R86502]|uniref:glycosyltransferase family 4 protein n=1 Tax=Erythrobacter sp. R86502 TaxID=3093846 RepID=UPI0036D20B4C
MNTDRPYILDVSRLIWRLNSARLPTGIDRVCAAYLNAFADRSLALVQWQSLRLVLPALDSDRLFALLKAGHGAGFKPRLFAIVLRALLRRGGEKRPITGKILLNVGHTGLNAPGLTEWVQRNGVRPVYLIHDLIPITHPQFCREGEDARHRVRMRQALVSAHGIIANSQATLDDLAHFADDAGLPMPECLVAHLGVEPLATHPDHSIHPRPYFLASGTIEARKNHALLLRLWRRLRDFMGAGTPDLIFIGQRGWLADDVFAELDRDQPPHGRVIELGRCDDAALASWIAGSRAVLMPSHAEGYGLPVIEALALGAPVIANDLAVYREIAGDIPLLINVADEDAWLDALVEYSGESAQRQQHIAAAAGLSLQGWPDHIENVVGWLNHRFGQ